MSATSSVFNFRFENGRRYHAYAEGQYPVPNDEVGFHERLGCEEMTNVKIIGRDG